MNAEYETIQITNPTKEKFSARYNGELYTIAAGETRAYPRFVAFHIAKNLSNKMLEPEAMKLREEFKESVWVPQEGVLFNHDNASRRITLYDILLDKATVEEFFTYVPLKGFIGEMSVYDAYVSKKTSKSEAASTEGENVESTPTEKVPKKK